MKVGYGMEIRFNRTGAERKALVEAISEIVGEKPKYKGAPSFAYVIHHYTVDKDGTLIVDEQADSAYVKAMLTALEVRGFVSDDWFEYAVDDCSPIELTVEIPLEGFDEIALSNLEALVASKATLIQKSFGVHALPIFRDEDRLRFPWFTDASMSDAYSQFVLALCKMAKTQKRVIAKERPIENEKYAFRCFLLRLGFIGPEFALARKILLANLSGDGSFMRGSRKDATRDEKGAHNGACVEQRSDT